MSFPSSPGPAGEAAAAGGGDALAALGQRLRQAREQRELTAAELADRLRIGVEQLNALEAADRDRLPEPVFVIAQARRVAGALQLDIDPDLRALRDSGELALPPARPVVLPAPAARTPPPAAAGEAARWGSRAAGRGRLRGGQSLLARPPLLIAGSVLLLLAILWSAARLRQPAPVRVQRPVPVAVAPPPVRSRTVLIQSREPSWVEVRRPDGTMLYRGMLQGTRPFTFGEGLEVLAARPDLVSSRAGREPPRLMGPIHEVRWRSLPAPR